MSLGSRDSEAVLALSLVVQIEQKNKSDSRTRAVLGAWQPRGGGSSWEEERLSGKRRGCGCSHGGGP